MEINNFYIPNKIELLFDFFGDLDIKISKPYSKDKRENVLKWVRKLLEKNVLYAGEFNREKKFEKWNLPVNQIILKINSEWGENIDFPEFYNLVWFSYQKWYLEKLKDLGYNESIDWNWFVKNKIGNLEQWIEENRPK